MGGRFEKPCPIPSRRAERATSRNNRAMYNEEIWQDILKVWMTQPNLFELGCGQSTLHYAIYHQTNREWPSHHIRRVLHYAVNAGHVEYLHDHGTHRDCARFRLINKNPLPKPQEPVMQNVSDIIEANGKTIRENNTAREHKVPVGTLVEILVTPETEYCFGCYRGVRLYVVRHARDCDGTPLYEMSPNKNLLSDLPPDAERQEILFTRMNLITGLEERHIKLVNLAREEWPRVPPKGTYVIADHPISSMNPSRIFCVKYIEPGFTVRGEHTCWFSVTMLRLPTPEEAANMDNYHPEEL